jgi:hypothetical protein
MAYSDLDKSQAFILFASGSSYRKIADIMRTHPGCEKITHTTIRDWAETPDTSGKTWEDRKRETDALVKESETSAVVRQSRDIIQEIDSIIGDIVTDIKGKGLEFKTQDAAVYALKTLLEYQDKIKDKRKRVSIEDQVRCLIDAMHEIPEVKEVIQKNWKDIYARFEAKARELMARKQHE